MSTALETQIEVGDTVHLNSGSPDLIVIAKSCKLTVEWESDGKKKQAEFPGECVTRKAG